MLREQQFFVKFSNYDFLKNRIQYIGHVVSKDGIFVDPDKINVTMEWNVPKNTTDIKYFMGITNYYCKFIKGFSKIAYLITSL